MKRVIVADDDPSIRDIFMIILERAGYAVTVYPNGETLMQNRFEAPDIFILDKQLSGIDGLEVCKHLKSMQSIRNIPVIITSASPHVIKYASEAGADDAIEKPFRTKELLQMIEKHLSMSAA